MTRRQPTPQPVEKTAPDAPSRPGGRVAQRRRTRLAIVGATQALISRGVTPTVDDVAEAADVSRRTIYLHFTTLDQLLLDATVGLLADDEVERALTDAALDDHVSGLPHARRRVQALVAVLISQSEATLPLGRQIIRLTIERPSRFDDQPRRGYRRVAWLETALEPLRTELPRESYDRLLSALAIVVGWEATTVLEDVRGIEPSQRAAVLTWMATTLIDAALSPSAP